jgi:hypothetical protein
MALRASHEDNIQITITLDPPPTEGLDFETVLLLREGITLGGDRVRTYTSVNSVEADETAGDVDAFVTEWARVAFSQSPPPKQIKVGRKDLVGETYEDAYDAVLVEDCDFYPVVIDSRDAATQVAFSGAIEADEADGLRRLFVLQSSDADWKTAGLPAAYSTLAGRERTAVVFHDDNAEVADGAWAVSRAVFDPDVRSAPWDGQIFEVANLTAAPTDTEKGHLDDNHANHGLPYGNADMWIDPGVNVVGRFLHELVTADWFYARLLEDTAAFKIKYSARGRKVPLDDVGRSLIRKLLENLLAQGVAGEHFQAGQTSVTVQPISDDDRANGCIRASAIATLLGSARIFKFDLAFVRNPINVAE